MGTQKDSNHNRPFKSIDPEMLQAAEILQNRHESFFIVTGEDCQRVNAELAEYRRMCELADERFLERIRVARKNLTLPQVIASRQKSQEPTAPLLTTKEVAGRLRKSPSWVYHHSAKLGVRRLGKGRGADLLFDPRDLEAWLDGQQERRS
jgi:hypothetical protein